MLRSGASGKYLLLAQGDLDAVVTVTGGEKEWDSCAPEVIVREAGGTVTDGDGRPLHLQPERPGPPARGGVEQRRLPRGCCSSGWRSCFR